MEQFNNHDYVWETQRFLSQMGLYYPDLIDGIYGKETESAIAKFKQLYPDADSVDILNSLKSTVVQYSPTLDRYNTDILVSDIRRIGDLMKLTIEQQAYVLATIQHETSGTMNPVEECFYIQDERKRKSIQKGFRYYPYYGRGDVQLTWKENYLWATKMFTPVHLYQQGELAADIPTNFVANPDGLLNPQISLLVTLVGMRLGMFRRNHTLARFFSDEKIDSFNARLIVNGRDKTGNPDKADVIEQYYIKWLSQLRKLDKNKVNK